MSSYVPTDWVDGSTPLDEAHLDKIEQGIKAVSDILFSGGRLAAVGILVTDWNAATQNGWYRAAGSATNSPGPGVAAVGMTIADSPNYLVQIAYAHNDVTPPAPRIWFRTRIGGTWGGWALLSAGGGGGGGLDWEGAWAGATPYVKGDVVTHLGVTYGAVNDSTGQTPPAAQAAPGALPVIPLVTALPATPFDGQEVILTDSLTAPTYQWRLRYVAAKASNKWVYVGGTPRVVRADTLETLAIASATWQDPYVVKALMTLAVAGIYGVEGGATLIPNSACTNVTGIAVGGVNPALDGALVAGGYSPVGSARTNSQPEGTVTVTAGQIIELVFWHNQGGAMNMGRAAAYIKATPVAVGG